jgi:hypothetical protein
MHISPLLPPKPCGPSLDLPALRDFIDIWIIPLQGGDESLGHSPGLVFRRILVQVVPNHTDASPIVDKGIKVEFAP